MMVYLRLEPASAAAVEGSQREKVPHVALELFPVLALAASNASAIFA